MNINVGDTQNQQDVRKKVFPSKPVRKDGLVLALNHTIPIRNKLQTIRFIYGVFNTMGQLLAVCDHSGTIFIIDLSQNKFWPITLFTSCTIIKYSDFDNNELIVGENNGKVSLLDTENGTIRGELVGHCFGILSISFSHKMMCLTSSRSEAIIWDLKTTAKLQVLNLEQSSILKHVLFMPTTNNILACFNDDTIQIWKYETFEAFKQILPTSWNKTSIKCITFTKNGRAMVLGGHSCYLAVFLLDTWTLSKVIVLPDYILGTKKIAFIPQPFDGGSNRILVILSTKGIIYFYDMDEDAIISNISLECEVIRFDCATNGKHVSFVMSSGYIYIFNITSYLPHDKQSKEKLYPPNKSNVLMPKTSSNMSAIYEQIKHILSKDKLLAILKEFGHFPDSYRVKIWTSILQLPNNIQQYNMVINRMPDIPTEDVEKNYPLFNKRALKNLKKLMFNLVSWFPFLAQVKYLPVFVFPFVKVFQNEPILCFEAVCTILVNWCQHWFEYFPLPPINILAMVENLLRKHDPDLIKHLSYMNITSQMYAWPILETAFSEVLTTSEWLILWDHILTNEPSFFLMCVVAYNILQRNMLLSYKSLQEFETFYHQQSPSNIKTLISKSYSLLNTTDEKSHPRQFLNFFVRMEDDSYRKYIDYPKQIINVDKSELENLKREDEILKNDLEKLRRKQFLEQEKEEQKRIQFEEKLRLRELENAYRQRVKEERNKIKEQRKRLCRFRKQLYEEEVEILNLSRNRIVEKNTQARQRQLERLLTDIEHKRTGEELEVFKAEEDLVQHYSELLKHKTEIEEILKNDTSNKYIHKQNVLERHQRKLSRELEKIREESTSKQHLKQLNVATGIVAVDDLIQRVELELAKKTVENDNVRNSEQSHEKLRQLEAETKELEMQVSKLLNMLAKSRLEQSECKISELKMKNRKIIESRVKMKKKDSNTPVKNNESQTVFEKDFIKIKKLLQEARDGYTSRPCTPKSSSKSDIERKPRRRKTASVKFEN